MPKKKLFNIFLFSIIFFVAFLFYKKVSATVLSVSADDQKINLFLQNPALMTSNVSKKDFVVDLNSKNAVNNILFNMVLSKQK